MEQLSRPVLDAALGFAALDSAVWTIAIFAPAVSCPGPAVHSYRAA